MKYSGEERGIVWLAGCTEFDYRERVALLRACKNPALLIDGAEEFCELSVKEERRALLAPPQKRREATEKLLSEMEKKGYFALTLLSDDYPESLKWTEDMPIALFGTGRRELLKGRRFCIVGSRSTPVWAAETTRRISEELGEHFVIVTGLAEGGDAAAIEGAIGSGVICVLPCGLDECYPSAHHALKERIAKSGLLLSEYPLKEKVRTYSFHARNRILAGLSEGVLVVSAGEKSGTSITAGRALDYGRDVFAFPYNIGVKQGVGCNALLKKGAVPVTETEDLLSYYGLEKRERAEVVLSPEEEKLLSLLREHGELHTAILAERAGMRVFEASAALSSLELKKLVAKAGGNKYCAL